MKIEIEKNKFYIDEKLNTLFVEDLGTNAIGGRIANDKGKLRFGNKKSIYKKIYKQFLYQEIEVNKNSNINCLDNTYFNQGTKMNLNYNYICSDNVCSLENTVKNNDEIKPINYYNSQNVK